MVEKPLAGPCGIDLRHLSHADLSRQRREELDLDQVADRGARVAANRPLSPSAQRFGAVVRHQEAGVDVHQYRPSRRARTTAWLTGSPVTRIDALNEPSAGSRRPF